MEDLLIYCPDTAALVAELQAQWPHRLDVEDPDNPRFLIEKTPTRRKGAKTLALVRCRPDQPEVKAGLEDLAASGVIEVLGTPDFVLGPLVDDVRDTGAGDANAQARYFSVHDMTPRPVLDEDGQPTGESITPPLEIGRFA